VLAVDGRDDIGGLDIDAAIVTHLGTLYGEKPEWARLTSPSTVEDRRFRRMLWDDVRIAKERLSRSQSADVAVPLVGADAHLTRTELETLARPVLLQTVRVTEGALRWAKLAEGRLAGVFLVGGASRIPLVATLLHQTLGEPPLAIEQPEMVVAEGALFATTTTGTKRANTVTFESIAVSPTSAAPVSPSPAGPPGRTPVWAASAPVSVPPVSPGPAPPFPSRAIPPQAVRVPQPTLIAPVVQSRRPAAPVYRPRPRPNVLVRALKLAVITAILVAVPTTVAYLAFHYAQGTPPWPIDISW
jgi:molecular chaperone DnaK